MRIASKSVVSGTVSKMSKIMLGYQIGITYSVTFNIGTRAVMTRYALNLPDALKRAAERLAKEQGVSLTQFILCSIAEKVGTLLQAEGDDSNFPNVAYRRGASGVLSAVLRGTGIRVQTIVIASENMSPAEIAGDYDLTVGQVQEALNFYRTHQAEIDAFIQAEVALEPKNRLGRRVS
jgi:uncharacterized protein (DUF433 family)